ncbi:MAG: anti-sigma factor [Actinomycetota bacterium]|nr:anti-sigma factor [Actinomycetota bacterium]
MVHPDPDVLADLALGDSEGEQMSERHLSSCPVCSATVEELRRVRDLARGLDADDVVWERPGPGLWARIERDLDADPPGEQPAATLRAVPRTGRGAHRARRTTSFAWVAAAAVVGIAVGMGAAWSFWRAPSNITTVASVALDTLDTRQHLGEAVLQRHDGTLDLRVEMGSLDTGPGYLEVWLLNADGKRMVSLGVMSQAGTTFPVSSALIEKGYVIVDVSREGFDDRPAHSGDSLVRGRLAV